MNDLIPHLRDLCFTRSGFDVPADFAETYIKLHNGDWEEAQEHWEYIVMRALNTDAVDQRASGLRAMRQAVRAASALIHNSPLQERCPRCPAAEGERRGE